MGVRLPAEYQEVEYLEGQGAQYIITDIPHKSGLRAQYEIEFSSHIADTQQVCASFGESGKVIYFPYISNNKWHFGYASARSTTTVVNENVRYKVDAIFNADSQTVKVNDNIIANRTDSMEIDLSYVFYMFASNNMNSPRYAYAKIYTFIVSDSTSGSPIANYIPCYRKADSEPGMYNLVSKTFYTNQGTGEFLVGPDVVNHISPRLMDRRRALIAKLTSLFRKVITSQTGLASFDTNVAKPMKVTCEFSPKQDLHGYDNPWPAGGGKNLFNESTLFDIASYPNQGSYGYYYTNDLVLKPNTEYVVSATGNAPGNDINYYFVTASGSGSRYIIYSGSINTSGKLTTGEDGIIKIGINKGTCSTHQDALDLINNNVKIQLEEGSTATTYAPYENICPIEAWDGCTIASGKVNMWNGQYESGAIDTSTGIGTMSSLYSRSVGYIQVKAGESYYYVSPESYRRIFWYDGDYNFIGCEVNTNPVKTAPANACFARIFWKDSAVSDPSTMVSLNHPSTDTAVHEYVTPTTLHLPFNNPGTYDFLPIQEGTGDPSPENIRPITPGLTITRDDNTTLEVWGGSLTVNADGTGSLVSKYIKREIQNFSNVSAPSGSGMWAHRFNLRNWTTTYDKAAGLNNMYSDVAINNGLGTSNYSIVGMGSTADMYFYDDTVSTVEEFKTKYNGHYIVYETFTTTYTLSVAETSRAFEALGLGKNLGPLYDGTVTLNEDGSCDVVVDRIKETFNGNESWKASAYYGQNTYLITKEAYVYDTTFATMLVPVCNMFKGVSYAEAQSGGWQRGLCCPTYDVGMGGYAFTSDIYDGNPNTWKTYLASLFAQNTPLELITQLKTPLLYHFDNIGQLQSFLGANNVWSDLNGAITVKYYKKQQ